MNSRMNRIHVCTFRDSRDGKIYRIEFPTSGEADAWDEGRLKWPAGTSYAAETMPHAVDKEWSSIPRDYNPTCRGRSRCD